jgi:hypothetical protein
MRMGRSSEQVMHDLGHAGVSGRPSGSSGFRVHFVFFFY